MRVQDFFVWGPPCKPYSRLNNQRKDIGFNPLTAPNAMPFVLGARHIRTMAWLNCILCTIMVTQLHIVYNHNVILIPLAVQIATFWGTMQPSIAIMEEAFWMSKTVLVGIVSMLCSDSTQ